MDMIGQQKALADRVYALLSEDYDVLLAGGAPRDWYIERPANDLDFYVYSENPENDLLDISERLGVELKPLGGDKYKETMDGEPDLRGVFEGEMYGQKVQFMFVALSPFYFVKRAFDLSVCKVWYKDGEICMDWEARLSFRERLIVMKDGFNGHSDKLMQRAPWNRYVFLGSWDRALGQMGERRPLWNRPLFEDFDDLDEGLF